MRIIARGLLTLRGAMGGVYETEIIMEDSATLNRLLVALCGRYGLVFEDQGLPRIERS